jgi:hypothetical protein
MRRSTKFALRLVAVAGLGVAIAAIAHPGGMGAGMMHGRGPGAMHGMGPGMMHGMGPGMAGSHGPAAGPMAGRMQHDDASSADMQLVHQLITNHDRIKRTVANLPDGIRTVTESDDPQVAQAIKAHVASMAGRLSDGREFNMFSTTLPVLFANKDKIRTTVETTEKGSVVTQTSGDPVVVAALQAHAIEVSELAREGMVAMMRGARAAMGAMPRGRSGGPSTDAPNSQPPAGRTQ